MEWRDVSGEFSWDGSWRDIYVLGTDIGHWQRAIDRLRVSAFQIRYARAGVDCALPVDAAEAFPKPGWADRLLSVDLGGVTANSHFFEATEIEFDLVPSEVKGQRELDSVIQFMHLLADATGREAILTPENMRHIVIFLVRPNEASVEYTPFGGFNEA